MSSDVGCPTSINMSGKVGIGAGVNDTYARPTDKSKAAANVPFII